MTEVNNNLVPATEPRTIKFYGCGGCGINTVNQFLRTRNKAVPGFATVQTAFIDTSKSNLDKSVPASDVYIFENVDGGGKDQFVNYDIINDRRLEILNKFRPADLNIFVHSGSGGSGPVIAQVLINELLQRGEQVLVVCIGNAISKTDTENTLSVLQRYEKMVAARGRPLAMHYRENSATYARGEVDRDIHAALLVLCILFSGQNRELDSQDLKHFLDYNLVTEHPPMLTGVEFYNGNIVLKQGEVVFSVASLTDDSHSSDPGVPVAYHCDGFIPPALIDNTGGTLPMHFATIGGYFNNTEKALTEKIRAFEETMAATKVRSALSSKPISSKRDFMQF